MSRPAPASSPIRIRPSSSRNASIKRKRCSAPPKKPSASPAPPRADNKLFDAGHVLAAANADGAAFDPDGSSVELQEMSSVAVAVVDVVETSRPLPRPIRDQGIQNRHADQRPATLRRIRIILVGPGQAGFRVDV